MFLYLIRNISPKLIHMILRVKILFYKEPLIGSKQINDSSIFKRNKTVAPNSNKGEERLGLEDSNVKKYTFSERSPMMLGAQDSPTLTYEKRLFSVKSFEGKVNKVRKIYIKE